ncbi:3-oxoacyl-ACP reductase FabG [Galbibacter sp. PAP.153]|uniref:3-oxoacyl-ACP reductase FabG n=1 Tax=Galbibacter sp. PAP.153 TaxID=3104623 RepID=UPI003008E7AF
MNEAKKELKKYALVTGGSRGIGRAICIQLAKDFDYNILINYHQNESAAQETLKLVRTIGGNGEIIQFDVASINDVKIKLDDWQEKNKEGIIEVIINNAGITKDGLFMWMQPDDWKNVIDTSLQGFFNVTNHLIQKLLVHRYGRIVNIVSVSGLKGTPGQTNYSAAKGAIVAATKALSQEVAKRNITVNAVAPGFIETDMTTDLDEKELRKLIPANRFGKPEEVAHAVSFLTSEKSSYITGEIININGGIYS